MKHNQLYTAYMQIIQQQNQQIITENIITQVWNKFTSMFNCFNNVMTLSDNISTGNWDGNLEKLKSDRRFCYFIDK